MLSLPTSPACTPLQGDCAFRRWEPCVSEPMGWWRAARPAQDGDCERRLLCSPPPSDEGNCHNAGERLLLVTSYQVPMRRIGLAVALVLILLRVPLATQAQQTGSVTTKERSLGL